MLPGNFLVVIIVFVLLQPFQGSRGRIGTATEDLHGANWLLNVCTETDLDIRNLISSNAYSESKGQENKRGKKIKKQAKIQSHLRILLMMAQVFNLNSGEERQEDLLNSRPACMVYTESSRLARTT